MGRQKKLILSLMYNRSFRRKNGPSFVTVTSERDSSALCLEQEHTARRMARVKKGVAVLIQELCVGVVIPSLIANVQREDLPRLSGNILHALVR